MFKNETDFLAALDPEALSKKADDVIARYKEVHPGALVTKQAISLFFESEYGPTVKKSTNVTYLDDLYLIPIKADGIPALDTTAIDRKCRITPVRINPKLLPIASKRQAKLLGLSDDLSKLQEVDSVTKPVSQSKESFTTPDSNLFSFDFVGGDPILENGSEPEPEPETKEAEPVADASVPLIDRVVVSTKDDIHALVRDCYGTSVGATEAVYDVPNDDKRLRNRMGYTDVCQRRPRIKDPLQDLLKAGNLARITAVANPLMPQDLREKKLAKAKRKAQRAVELQNWYGMKKRKIGDDDKLELAAINLRGVANSNKGYLNTKQVVDFADQDEGFFQYGHVVAGFGEAKVSFDRSLDDTAPKKKKALLRSIF
eukprot:Blabericola_migrator_1__7152@NODE_3625_length_1623_cov_47_385604_g2246_i0_p1_GENE_NODE_3625_length_1623_cov_47_385604_g2246_i0NODE_3625_length_1623_cov_47_385604_g2246_i0_p1_ORF_typecomplete_len371_score79_82Fcf2/PF08698_11/7_4e03Fcf2/PF08698_11/1_4e03Fcf2/PF08698_11/4_4e06DUF3410/PF11890_8/3_7e03DUF3410/PF11890_8/0_1YqzE/PF14038_6/0_53YqzE/PF14038_6/9_1e03_NODE_3625_length_1623_cov_47_385604_g2246_i03721484